MPEEDSPNTTVDVSTNYYHGSSEVAAATLERRLEKMGLQNWTIDRMLRSKQKGLEQRTLEVLSLCD